MMTLFLKSLKFTGNYLNNPDYTNTVNSNMNYSHNGDVIRGQFIDLMAQARNAWIDFGASVVDFFKSYTFKEIIFTLKTVSLILSFLALAMIIFIFFKSNALGKPAKQIVEVAGGSKKKIKKVLRKWAKIEKKLASETESNYKLAVLEADNLYDEILRAVGFEKEKTLSNLDDIKNAKRIKRNIIDDSGFLLTRAETENSLNAYKKGLEELGAL